MFRDICLHKYTKWEIVSKDTFGLSIIIIQKRTCIKCDKIDLRTERS